MTLDQFRYFLETARFQHVGKASRSLHISPSSISSAIRALEEHLGCDLFERSGQRMRLTEEGHRLREKVERLLDQVSDIRSSIRGASSALSGTARLGGSHFLAIRYLGSLAARIQASNPELMLELNSLPTASVVKGVLEGSLDGGLCFSPLRHPDLKGFELYQGQLSLVVREGHPFLKSRGKTGLAGLSQYPACLHLPSPGVDLCETHPMFDKHRIVPRVHSLWDNDAVALEFLKSSDAWAMVPDLVAREYKKELRAIPLPSDWYAPYPVEWIVRSHRAENPLWVVVLDQLKKAIR